MGSSASGRPGQASGSPGGGRISAARADRLRKLRRELRRLRQELNRRAPAQADDQGRADCPRSTHDRDERRRGEAAATRARANGGLRSGAARDRARSAACLSGRDQGEPTAARADRRRRGSGRRRCPRRVAPRALDRRQGDLLATGDRACGLAARGLRARRWRAAPGARGGPFLGARATASRAEPRRPGGSRPRPRRGSPSRRRHDRRYADTRFAESGQPPTGRRPDAPGSWIPATRTRSGGPERRRVQGGTAFGQASGGRSRARPQRDSGGAGMTARRRRGMLSGLALAGAGIVAAVGAVSAPALVGVPPTASITASPNPALVNENVTFDGSGSTGDGLGGSITTYEWDLDGDSTFETNTGSNPTVSRSYSAPGTITVALRVTDGDGDTDEDSVNLVVNSPPDGRVHLRAVHPRGQRADHVLVDLVGRRGPDPRLLPAVGLRQRWPVRRRDGTDGHPRLLESRNQTCRSAGHRLRRRHRDGGQERRRAVESALSRVLLRSPESAQR